MESWAARFTNWTSFCQLGVSEALFSTMKMPQKKPFVLWDFFCGFWNLPPNLTLSHLFLMLLCCDKYQGKVPIVRVTHLNVFGLLFKSLFNTVQGVQACLN